jgi:hypothetical protein
MRRVVLIGLLSLLVAGCVGSQPAPSPTVGGFEQGPATPRPSGDPNYRPEQMEGNP